MDEAISETVAAVHDLAETAASAEHSDGILAAVIEGANERVEAAERTAEQIAEAAMETARGERLNSLEERINTWQNDLSEIRGMFQDLSSQVEVLRGQLAATATIAVSEVASPMASSSQTPPTSEVDQAITEVTEILPEALGQENVAVAPPAAQSESGKRKRWI